MEPAYIFILAIAGMLTAALTILKIFSMKRNPEAVRMNAYSQIQNNMKLLEKNLCRKRDITLCDERHNNVQQELLKGHKQFEAMLKVQSQQAEMLARIDERVEYLAEQNGFGKRKK